MGISEGERTHSLPTGRMQVTGKAGFWRDVSHRAEFRRQCRLSIEEDMFVALRRVNVVPGPHRVEHTFLTILPSPV